MRAVWPVVRGKTDGYHDRRDIRFSRTTVSALFRQREHNTLAEIAHAQIEEIGSIEKALRFGVAVAASGGKLTTHLTKADRAHANTYALRLDAAADVQFFAALEDRFQAADETEVATRRAMFARGMIAEANKLLLEAIETVPCPAIHRHRARARATSAFWGHLRRRSVFSDQPEIFGTKEANDVA